MSNSGFVSEHALELNDFVVGRGIGADLALTALGGANQTTKGAFLLFKLRLERRRVVVKRLQQQLSLRRRRMHQMTNDSIELKTNEVGRLYQLLKTYASSCSEDKVAFATARCASAKGRCRDAALAVRC